MVLAEHIDKLVFALTQDFSDALVVDQVVVLALFKHR